MSFLFQSESCKISIPEIDLEVTAGTLGGRFTTLEALLVQIHDEILNNPFMAGDSGAGLSKDRAALEIFLTSLKEVIDGKRLATIVLEDPLGLSYLQNLYAPDEDPNMRVEEFDRTWEDNELWGLNDMKTTGYEEDAKETATAADSESAEPKNE